MSAPGRRAAGALVAAAALAAAAAWPMRESPVDPRPNVIVVMTDDQPWDTLDAMPWLSSELSRDGSGWTSFPLAFANAPLCCPSRATFLSGRLPRHTGVLHNEDAIRFDESDTLATRLHDGGYRTGIVGKYLNRYPFDRVPYVPPGWDRAVIKRNAGNATVYRNFDVVDQGSPVHVVDAYATDWLAERAVSFVRAASPDRPFFLLFTPSAPHEPWIPADRHVGTAVDVVLEEAPTVVGALRDAPPWVASRPLPSAAQRATWIDERRSALETLAAVDEAVHALVDALGERLEETVIIVLSDHGYSFGEHRWGGKKCPYDACVRIPFVVHLPDGNAEPEGGPVSIVDLLPTILDLARVPLPAGLDGSSFAGRLGVPGSPTGDGVAFLEWAGDGEIPAWEAVRTSDLKLIRYADGTEELHDLGGVLGRPDPFEADDRAEGVAYRGIREDLRRLLGRHPGRR